MQPLSGPGQGVTGPVAKVLVPLTCQSDPSQNTCSPGAVLQLNGGENA